MIGVVENERIDVASWMQQFIRPPSNQSFKIKINVEKLVRNLIPINQKFSYFILYSLSKSIFSNRCNSCP